MADWRFLRPRITGPPEENQLTFFSPTGSGLFQRPAREGYIPSPPRYVRIVEWLRPDYFTAEFQRGDRVHEWRFVIVSRQEGGKELKDGWYRPAWTALAPYQERSNRDVAKLGEVEGQWPNGSIVELQYPLATGFEEKIGWDGEVKLDSDLVRTYYGFLVLVDGFAPDSVVIPQRQPQE